jgi:hypothetical protein
MPKKSKTQENADNQSGYDEIKGQSTDLRIGDMVWRRSKNEKRPKQDLGKESKIKVPPQWSR